MNDSQEQKTNGISRETLRAEKLRLSYLPKDDVNRYPFQFTASGNCLFKRKPAERYLSRFCFRTDRSGRFTLDDSEVRQLHGRSCCIPATVYRCIVGCVVGIFVNVFVRSLCCVVSCRGGFVHCRVSRNTAVAYQFLLSEKSIYENQAERI